MPWGRPWLQRSHPNFFFIYVATLTFHLWQASIGLFGPASFFGAPGLDRVNRTANPEVWGLAFAIIGVSMMLGLFRGSFQLSRLALAAGAALCTFRAVLIGLTISDGFYGSMTGVPVWFLAASLHLSQTGEPPFNPATAR